MLKHALGYLELGWSVFPLKPKDKTPLVKWQAYQTKKPTADEVTAWWKKWPDANIGLATGAISGVVVIDIDSAEGREAYTAEFGELHNTIRQTTGKPGGLHLLFAPRNGTKYQNMARTIPFVDVRGDGGYIVVSPSVHPNGTVYQWEHIDPLEMGIDDLLPIPDAVHDILARGNTEKDSGIKNEEGWVNDLLLIGVKEGSRNVNCTKLAGYYLNLYDGDTDMVEPILLNWDSLRCEPPLGFKVVRTIIKSVAQTRKRKMMGEFAEKLNSLTIVIYPDGTKKYQLRITGYEHYAEIDFATLVSNRLFNIAIGEIIDCAVPPMKGEAWRKVVNGLLKEAKNVLAESDETIGGLILNTIKTITPKTDKGFYKNNIVAFDDCIFFLMQTILDITYSYNIRGMTPRKMGKTLRDLGFCPMCLRPGTGAVIKGWGISQVTWESKNHGKWPFLNEKQGRNDNYNENN